MISENNLKATIKAYQKISPSILGNYVTKDNLSEELSNYVTEAPVDSNVYARKDKAWVEIDTRFADNNTYLIYGYNKSDIMTYELMQNL